jgi:hypothetical protein
MLTALTLPTLAETGTAALVLGCNAGFRFTVSIRYFLLLSVAWRHYWYLVSTATFLFVDYLVFPGR